MTSLSGFVITPLSHYADHALLTRRGKVYPIDLEEDVSYLVGEAMTEMGGFNHPIPVTTPSRTAAPLLYTVHLEDQPRHNRRERRDDLEADLGSVGALWRPDGLYLPLWYAQLSSALARDEDSLTLALLPKAYEPRNPVLDDAQYFNNMPVFRAEQHKRTLPILRFDAGSGLNFYLGPLRMSRGSFNFANLIQNRGVHELFRIGEASTEATPGKLSVRYDDTYFVFDLWGQRVTVHEDDGPGFGNLHAWGGTWAEGNSFHLTLTTQEGFKTFGPYPLPSVGDLALSAVTAGDLTGFYMPGSSSYKVPFVSLHPQRVSEQRSRNTNWLRALAAFPSLTVEPPPWGLGMNVTPVAPEVTAGKSVALTVQLTPIGGVPVATQYVLLPKTDEPGLTFEVGEAAYSTGAGEDGEGEAVTRITFKLTIKVSEEIAEGTHSVNLVARAEGWVDNPEHPYYEVFAEDDITLTAHLFDAEVAPNALAVNRVLALPAWSKDNFLKDDAAGAARPLVIGGRVFPTSRGDGLRSTGKAGAFVRSSSLGKRLSDGAEVAARFANPADIASGAVVLALASTTRKGDWCYAYKTTGGFKIRTSLQAADGTSQQADSPLLASTSGASLVLLTTPSQVILWDEDTDTFIASSNPGWPLNSGDDSRASYLCLYLSDGTVSLPSAGILLTTTVHPSPLSPIRRDRNMRFITDQYTRRRTVDARPEWPASTLGVFEIHDGEMLKDRTFQSPDLQLVGTVTQDTANGRLTTSGSGNNAIWTGWLSTITWANSFAFAALMWDWEASLSARQLSISSEDVLNDWFSLGHQQFTVSGKIIHNCVVASGDANVFAQTEVRLAASPKKLFVFSFEKAPASDTSKAGVLTIREAFSAITLKVANIPKDWVGRVALASGAVYRGKNSTGTVAGVFQQTSSKLEALWYGDEPLVDSSVQGILDNLNGTYPKLPPLITEPSTNPDPNPNPNPDPEPGGGGTTTPPPVDTSSTSIVPRLAISLDTVTPTFPTTYGSDWYALYEAARPNYNPSLQRQVPLDFNGDRQAILNKLAQSDAGLTSAQKAALAAEKQAILDKYDETGLYHIGRRLTSTISNLYWAVRVTKKKWAADETYEHLQNAIDTLDWRGAPNSLKKASEVDAARTDYLGHLYGAGGGGPNDGLGTRTELEDSVKCKALLEGAYTLWTLRAHDTRYLPLVYKVLAYYKYHLKPDWKQYWTARGTWYKTGSTTEPRYSLTIRKGFAHSDTSEADAEALLAKIETEMWIANLRDPVQVQLSGYDYPKADAGKAWNQYYGSNTSYRRTWTGSYTLDATSANVYDHQGWKNAKAWYTFWVFSKHVVTIPASQIRNASKRSLYPTGIVDWAQMTGVYLSDTWNQPTVYHNETDMHILSAWVIGLLADVFGSAGAAHEWLKKVSGARHVGSGVRDDGTLTYDGMGYRSVSSTAAPSSSDPNRRLYTAESAYSGTTGLAYNGDYSPRYAPTTNAIAHQFTGVPMLALGGFNNTGGAKTFLTQMWNVQGNKRGVIGGQLAGMIADVIRDYIS